MPAIAGDNSNIQLYIFPDLPVEMICGGIILVLFTVEQSEFMLSSLQLYFSLEGLYLNSYQFWGYLGSYHF